MVRKKNTGANPLMALERYIRIKADTTGADKAIKQTSKNFDSLALSAKKAQTEISKVGKTSKSTSRDIKAMDGSVKSSGKSYETTTTKTSKFNLSLVALAVSAGVVAVKLKETIDAYTLIERQIKRSETTQDGFNRRFEELLDLSNAVGADLQSTVSLYARLEFATRDLSLGQAKTLQITETLTKAFKSTGLSSSETASAVLQLSQAFASGRLQGDEFRSVSENAPIILQALSKELGVTVGQLKALSSEGKITSEVLANAVLNSAEGIDSEFIRITGNTKTMDEGLAVARNGFLKLVGAMNETTGASNLVSKSFVKAGESFSDWADLIKNNQDVIGQFFKGGLINVAIQSIDNDIVKLTDSTNEYVESLLRLGAIKDSGFFGGDDSFSLLRSEADNQSQLEGDYARFSEKPEQARTQEQTESDYAEFAAQKRIEIEEKQNRELLQLSQGFYSQQLDIATSGFEAYTGIEQDAHTQMLQMSQAFYDQELDQLFESFEEKNAVAEVGWQDYANIASSAIQSIGTISANSVQSDINAIEQSRDARLSLAKTEEERVQISLDAEKKINAYRKKAFEDKKKADIVSAGINTALAVTKALADTANPYYAAAIGALGAVQISAIESSRFGGSTSSASPSAVPNQTNSASDTNRVVTTENLALTQIANELSNFDNDEPLPASLTKRIIVALDNQSTLGG